MKNSPWELAEKLPEYVQLELFPLTHEEIIASRMAELERKQDRQRKALFAENGKIKRYSEEKINEVKACCEELMSRLAIIERGLCQDKESHCEILEYALF